MISLGIDRLQERSSSNYPFVDSWNRRIGDVAIGMNSIYAVQIYVEERHQLPIHLQQVQKLQDTVSITFSDANNTVVGTAVFGQSSDPEVIGSYSVISRQLFRANGVVAGMLTCSPDFISACLAQRNSTQSGLVTVGPAAALLPECYIPINRRGAVCISVDGRPAQSAIYLVAGSNCELSADAPWMFSIKDSQEHIEQRLEDMRADKNGICTITVGDAQTAYNCKGGHLLLMHAPLSNARIVTQPGSIAVKGVLDD